MRVNQIPKAIRVFLFTLFIIFAGLSVWMIWEFTSFDTDLVFNFYSANEYDSSGNPIDAVAVNGDPVEIYFVSFEQIPDFCNQALVSNEDRFFYSHLGVNPVGLVRETLALLSGTETGGSTLHQQLIRMSSANSDSSLWSSILEIPQANRLALGVSREKILTDYWNHVYLGGFNYGIEAASLNYFGKSSQILNDAECAYLVGMIPSPNNYSPETNPELGLSQQLLVLERMHANGFLSVEELEEVKQIDLQFSVVIDQ